MSEEKNTYMDKTIKKTITSDEYEQALMGRCYYPYVVRSITWIIGTMKYNLELELKE